MLTTIPRGSRWCALDATFEGPFSERYPGIWTPVPWIAEDRPHLILMAGSERFVHVVVETPTACFCTAVHAHTDSQQLRADLPSFQGRPRVLSIPDEELQYGTTLRDGDVVIELVNSGFQAHPISLPVWGLLASILQVRMRHFGCIALLLSFRYAVAMSEAGPPEAPSPDSSEARTIRSRLGRGHRSRSRSPGSSQPGFSFFPLDARRANAPPTLPVHMWHPSPPAARCCFGTFPGIQGELTVRTLCPVSGLSEPGFASVASEWSQIVAPSQSHCGRWTDSFLPVRGVRHQGSLTLLPASPPPFASIVVQGRGVSRAVLVPQFATLPQLRFVAQQGTDGLAPVDVTTSPGISSSDRRRPLCLRNGDCIGLSGADQGREGGLSVCLQYRDTQAALSAASWALPFTLELGGSARFWFAARRDPSHVILRGGTWWDPARCSFRDALGEPMRGTWIPALSGCLPDLHLISPGAPLAAHVFCVDTRDNHYPLVTAHLGGPEARGPPFGWHWHPSIAATSPTHLRDGDVLVVDPAADRVWDPLAGVPPSIALDKLAVGAASALGLRFSLALCLLLCSSGASAELPPVVPSPASPVSPWESSHPFPVSDTVDHSQPGPAPTAFAQIGCPSSGYEFSLSSCSRLFASVNLGPATAAARLILFGVACWSRPRAPVCLFLGAFHGVRMSGSVRLESASFAHRLWQPGDGLQDPVWSRETSCPSEFRSRFPAWNAPPRVCPAVYGGGWEWIPSSIDPSHASVVLVAPPMPRAALLPSVCTANLLLRSLQLQLPSLSQVEVTPAAWRGTRRTSVPTLYLRDGDVVQVRAEGWMPMLRAPPIILHCTPHSAARDAFWGLPFRIRDPGMIFAWRPDDPRPLCVPSRRGEAWDPEGCTFRPSLASFSPKQWVPAAIEDPLGLHLMLEGASVVWVHHFLAGHPPRAVCSSRDEVPPYVRDGDVSGAVSTSASLALGVVVVLLCDHLSVRISACLCLAGFLSLLGPPEELSAFPVAHHPPAQGIAALLLEVYPLAWGAPSDCSSSFQVSLDSAAQVYASLSAHYLARPLRTDFPDCAHYARKQAWQNFPPWGTGPPEELCIATDGSGLHHGGWAFAVWCLWRGQWYRYGWDGRSYHLTPWLLPAAPSASDLRSYFGELGALTSAALWLSAWWDCLKVSTTSAPTRVTIAVDNIAALGVASGRATPSHPQAQVCRGVWQAVQSRLSTDFRHVAGHCGILVNEIADALAGYVAYHPKAASVGYARLPPQVAHDLAQASPQLWLLPTAQIVDGRLVWCPPTSTQDAPDSTDSQVVAPDAAPVVAPTGRTTHRLSLYRPMFKR